MDSALVGAASALGGVVLGQLFARSGEYRKWLRTERHRAASELLATGEAMRRHSAAHVVAQYAGMPPESRELDGNWHLADLERLELALEAVTTVFPRRVAETATEFGDAARAVAYVISRRDAPAPIASPGDVYMAKRSALTAEVRRLVAPSPLDRLRFRRAKAPIALPAPTPAPEAKSPASGGPA